MTKESAGYLNIHLFMSLQHDTQLNDTQHIDTQHNDIQHKEIQHNGTQHNYTQHDVFLKFSGHFYFH